MEFKTRINRGSFAYPVEEVSKLNGQQVLVTIEKLPLKRSEAYSRYYWGVVVVYWFNLFKSTLDEEEARLLSKEAVHYWLTKTYSPVERVNPFTQEVETVGALQRKMTNEQLKTHITHCTTGYLAETGELIPAPQY